MQNNTLLVRNIRGNWSARFLYEYFFRHKKSEKFFYVNLINLEVFPPHKAAPSLLKSRKRESLISFLYYRNPLPSEINKRLKKDGVSFVGEPFHRRVSALILTLKIMRSSDSSKLSIFESNKIPFGKFLHTTLIAKYGIKHFKMNPAKHLANSRVYYRYFISYFYAESIINKYGITKVVLINGRDIVGVAFQLAAYQNQLNVVTLEAGFGDLPNATARHSLYGEWQGNMHHWYCRQLELLRVVKKNVDFPGAAQFIEKHFGLRSKWWINDSPEIRKPNEIQSQFVCFFTTSERESTTCPTGIPTSNFFDQFDQVEQIEKLYAVVEKLGLTLVIRMHPNFTNSRVARNELQYFRELTRNWSNCILISNDSNVNSYEIAQQAKFVFTFRSSLSAEFSMVGINCFQTAPTAWSRYSDIEPIVSKEDMHRVLTERVNKNKHILKDWEAFAMYYAMQGTPFESMKLNLESELVSQNGQSFVQELSGLRLDIPKLPRRGKRNYR